MTIFDFHPHLQARMSERGVTKEEIEETMREGKGVADAKPGTLGKVFVIPYNSTWENKFFEEKEITVYYKIVEGKTVLLTVVAKYGKFSTGGKKK